MSFASDVRKFVKAADWLTDVDAPAVGALKVCAQALDEGPISASLIGQYRLLHKQLAEGRNPQSSDEDDDLLSPKED